jgi:pantothenate kinase
VVPAEVRVSAEGAELDELAGRLGEAGRRRGRWFVGLVGEPGAGKSVIADALAARIGARAAVVPLDGFHLADVQLARLGALERKGAPDTFDAWGYAALLERLRGRPETEVYAPGFERDLEQPLAGAIVVPPEVEVVVTEGNYLLVDRPPWQAVRAQLDEVWFVEVDPEVRLRRLTARHVASGKDPVAAQDWVARVDEPNARLVREGRARADLLLEVTSWRAP